MTIVQAIKAHPAVTALIVVALALAWFFRYDFQARDNGQVAAFMLNRWTGTVYLVTTSSIREITEASDSPQTSAAPTKYVVSTTPVDFDPFKDPPAATKSSFKAAKVDPETGQFTFKPPDGSEATRALALETMDTLHPGWRTLIASADYRAWIAKQPESVRKLTESQNPLDADRVLTLYKQHAGR